jgi:glycosyltransferase involved in cell wall biosynthesis
MTTMYQIFHFVFFSSLILFLHSYILYPFTLIIIKFFRVNKINKQVFLPFVSIIICARNEQYSIDAKIKNTLSLEYPDEKKEIIIISDGSTDKTPEIALIHQSHNVKVIIIDQHVGKESAQITAYNKAGGEILIFTDTSTRLEPDAIIKLCSNFADPTIGCVSSTDLLIDSNGRSAEGLYLKYEMALRELESKTNSLIGSSGSCFAVRRAIFNSFSNIKMSSDFTVALLSAKAGMKAIQDRTVIGSYAVQCEQSDEFRRKVRTITRGIYCLFNNVEFLNPFKYGLLAYQLFSHKLMRWLTPFLMISLFISTAALSTKSHLFQFFLLFQFIFYLSGISVQFINNLKLIPLFKIFHYLLIVHIAIFLSWINFFFKKVQFTWNPLQRDPHTINEQISHE